MDASKITCRFSDTGYYLARCNHSTGVIELNSRAWSRMPYLMRDYIWCHEYVHLLYDIYDEDECNVTAGRIFLSRAKNESDRRERQSLVEASQGRLQTSNVSPWSQIINFFVEIGTDVIEDTVNNRQLWDNYENGGFNAIDEETQKSVVDSYMKQAFKKSRRVSDRSARDIFWASMEPIAGKTKDATYAQFVSNHRWVSDYIAKYEKKYGFGFGDVLPVDNSDVYMWIAVGTLAVVAAILIIKKYRK